MPANFTRNHRHEKWELLVREAASSFRQSVPFVGQYRPSAEIMWKWSGFCFIWTTKGRGRPISWAAWCVFHQEACLPAVGTGRQWSPLRSAATRPQRSCLFSLSIFYYHRQQRWKITGVAALLPFVTLTKSAPLALRLQNEASWSQPRSQRPHLPWHSCSSSGISLGLTWGTNTQMYCSSLISRKSSVRICTSSWLMLRPFPGWLLSPDPSCSSGPLWFIYVSGGICHRWSKNPPPAFTEVLLNWRSFSYRQSGGLPENHRGKQFVHEHSDRHGISGKTSPSLLHLSCVAVLPLPLIFTHRKVSLLMFKKWDLGVWCCRWDQANTWAGIHELQTNNQYAKTKVCVLDHKATDYIPIFYTTDMVTICWEMSLYLKLSCVTVICLPLMKLVNQWL